MSQSQQTLDKRAPSFPSHLTKKTDGLGLQLPVTKAREYGCRRCENRVTRNSGGTAEYGHEPSCPYHYQRGDGE